MKLIIMTRGRVNNQKTVNSIPESWRDRTMFVCPPEEVDPLYEKYGLATVPYFGPANYSSKFQWIMSGGVVPHMNKIMVLDDDLRFSKRVERPDGTVGLQNAGTKQQIDELSDMFDEIEGHLDHVAQCGIQPRMMGQAAPLPYKEVGKVIVANGVNREALHAAGFMQHWKVDLSPILADTHLNCSLLSRGIPNRLVTRYCVDWAASQAAGGCDYRTMAMQEESIDILVEMFKPFVKKVVKKPKSSKWLGDERVDFTVRWKQMFQTGEIRAKRGLAAP